MSESAKAPSVRRRALVASAPPVGFVVGLGALAWWMPKATVTMPVEVGPSLTLASAALAASIGAYLLWRAAPQERGRWVALVLVMGATPWLAAALGGHLELSPALELAADAPRSERLLVLPVATGHVVARAMQGPAFAGFIAGAMAVALVALGRHRLALASAAFATVALLEAYQLAEQVQWLRAEAEGDADAYQGWSAAPRWVAYGVLLAAAVVAAWKASAVAIASLLLTAVVPLAALTVDRWQRERCAAVLAVPAMLPMEGVPGTPVDSLDLIADAEGIRFAGSGEPFSAAALQDHLALRQPSADGSALAEALFEPVDDTPEWLRKPLPGTRDSRTRNYVLPLEERSTPIFPCGIESSTPRVHVVLQEGGWTSLRGRLDELGPVAIVLVGQEAPSAPPDSWPAIFAGRLGAIRFWSPQLLHDGCLPIHDEVYARATIDDEPPEGFETRSSRSTPPEELPRLYRQPRFVYLRIDEDSTLDALAATARWLGGHHLAPVLVRDWPVDPTEPYQPWGLHQILPDMRPVR